jgi:hypothetical protein
MLKTSSSLGGLLIKLRIIGFRSLNGRDSQVLGSPRPPITTGRWLNYSLIGSWVMFGTHCHVEIAIYSTVVSRSLSFSLKYNGYGFQWISVI